MNLMKNGARAGFVAAVALAVVALLSFAIGSSLVSSDPETVPGKPTPTPLPEGLLGREPATKGLPADCPKDWQFFDNVELKYTICLPPAWGFNEGLTSGPRALSSLEPGHLRSLTIFSNEYFPYPVGLKGGDPVPADFAARLGQAFRLAIRLSPPWVAYEGCSPSTPRSIGGVGAVYCEDTYSITALGEADLGPKGDLHAIKVLLPLFEVPSIGGQDTSGFRLYIKLVSPSTRFDASKDFLWQIIETVRVYR